MQAGNADDALMTRLHGRDWHARAQAPRGRFRRHAAVTGAALAGVAGLAARRRLLAGAGLGAWIAGTAEFAAARIAPGPRTAHEVATMVVTSAVIPPAAVGHALRGRWRWRTAAPWPGRIRAVLFDRDGTLVHDVPYNGDPGRVAPVADAAATLRRLRDAGLQIGVISNQSGVGRGLISPAQVDAVNRAVEAAVGPIDTWQVCPHTPEDGCRCRKPAPGLVVRAAQALGVDPWECVVVGDIGSDVEAARNAGAAGLLVPTAVTRAEEVEAAPVVAGSLAEAADVVLRALADGRPIARAGRAARPPAVVAAGATATGAALAGAWSA
jgi:histidinol-phosphate phosphatase family protein